MRTLFLAVSFLLLTTCANKPTPSPEQQISTGDKYIWLENTANPQVRPWVDQHNAKSLKVLAGDPRAKQVAEQVREIITAEDRIPMPSLAGDMIRNFWQDKKHVRGIWRQTSLAEYAKSNPKWNVILDIDALNAKEGKSWVFKDANCLPPENNICLISLSDGGRDEVEVREFKVSTKSFLADGFKLPAAKSRVDWFDKDSLLVGTNFGPNSLTTSGYPRQVKLWKRGTPLASATLIFEGRKEDVEVNAHTNFRADGKHSFIRQAMNFFSEKIFLYTPGEPLKTLPFPETSNFQGVFQNFFFTQLREDWRVSDKIYPQGALLALPANDANDLGKIEIVYKHDDSSSLSDMMFTKDSVLLTILHNVRGEIFMLKREKGRWKTERLPLPTDGALSITNTERMDLKNRAFVTYQSFLKPTTLYAIEDKKVHQVKKLPAKFNSTGLVTEQFFAKSKDGTKVPYFVVHRKNMKFKSDNPTLMYGYGGFEVSETPLYLGAMGKIWLEKGGIYVVANIRGGGEYGPRWHEAALKENRQRAYDDFVSVAEDLFARKITSPQRLGIMGGSNGGLLVGVVATQHPEYFNAVVCEAALLDMIRYTKLPPGASWIGEYGDPDDPKMAAIIKQYSPYQNIHVGKKYPKFFFYISTADDRVQPGHTRKMAARLKEYGHDFLFFENTEGGHGGAADLEQKVKKLMLENIYLYQQLMD